MKTSKTILSFALAVIIAFSVLACLGTTVFAGTKPKDLDGYAKASDNVCDTRYDAPNATAQEINDLQGGGIFYIINNLGGAHPYAYNHNFGKFMDKGFMLEFSDYFNDSSTTTYYGYGTLLIMLCKGIDSDEYYRFNPGVVGVMLDFANGKVCLVESTMKILDYPFDVGPKDTYHKVKQVILESDVVKISHVMDTNFKVYFVPHGDDLRFTLDINGSVVSGDIDGDILKSYKHCPTDKTYVSIGSIDGNYHEWNEWSINFYGYKNLDKKPAVQNGDVTYYNGKVPVSDKNITWTGRWENNGKTATAYYQSSAEFKFTGNFIKVDTSKPILASVDGGKYKQIPAGISTIASGLERGEHTVTVLSTPEYPNPVIRNFYIAPEQQTKKQDAKKKITFISDQTALCGGEILDSYIIDTANKLQYNFSATISKKGLDDLSSRYFKLGESNSTAKDKNYKFDASTDCIVVSLKVDQSDKANYENFVSQLRKRYPKTSILCMTSFDENANTVKTIVEKLQKGGDKNIYCVNASKWGVELSSGVPTQDGHKTITSKLTAAIKSVMSGKATISVTTTNPSDTTQQDDDTEIETNDDVTIEYEYEEETEQENGIADYLWLIILVAAIVVLALLVVIFLPYIKKMFHKK